MKNEIVINLEEQYFSGEVLDICSDNYGIIYNIYKSKNKDFDVEYVDGREKAKNIKENFYDSCVMFLAFSSIIFKISRKILVEKIYNFLKEDGFIYIWDIDKGYGKTFFGKVNVIMPQGISKTIEIKDMNLLKDTSSKTILKLIEEFFNIVEFKSLDNIYYIKAQKKRRDNK
ncbi:class I SAM-dependent methyltransferase [Clostridium sp.]|jgi:hypothetical protein|uniref:class I SAM-dependent methyltransferase n=1 Tax=Clostridium sp. TaxID=1506 RepID=UPI0039F557A1